MSYVYIFNGQKLIKNAKNGAFWQVFDQPEACGQTVLPDKNWWKMPKIINSNATFLEFQTTSSLF